MVLSSKNVLSIDVTIIMGLLILLSFQSVGSPIYEKMFSNFSSDLINIASKLNGTDILIEKYCNSDTELELKFLDESDILEKCKEWESQKIELEEFGEAELNVAELMNLYNRENPEASKASSYILWGGVYVKFATVLMIIPFTISAIIESLVGFYSRKSDSSGIGTLFMIIGFGGIIIGMGYILYLTGCAIPNTGGCP